MTPRQPHDPPAGGAVVAAWRRRQRSSEDVAVSPGNGQADAGAAAPGGTGGVQAPLPEAIVRDTAASQAAAMAALLDLALGAPAGAASGALQPATAAQPATAGPGPAPAREDAAPAREDAAPAGERAAPAGAGAVPARPARPPSRREVARKRRGAAPACEALLAGLRLPLLIAILAVQVVLSLRLVWTNTAYIDEATYLWAGHLEITHWLHGTPVPPFQTWLSGAPVVYPPLGAVADSMGGLIGARLLSLAFITGATVLLWDTTSRLLGHRAALFAAALFAVLGPTQFLGALATYDAMALFLLAASAWCVVAARDRADSSLLLVAAACALALANATKYATALFDPVVLVLAALVIVPRRGPKQALGRAGYVGASVTALVACLVALGGPLYMAGILYTTLARASGGNSPQLVLADAGKWAGAVCVVAWLGVIIGLLRGPRGQAPLLALLATAGLLAPLEQARIHTITSLHKHVDFGAWLAAPAAGYALAQLSRISRRKAVSVPAAALIAVAAVVPVARLGAAQARTLFLGWPSSAPLIAKLRALARSYHGDYLAEDYDVPGYYLEGSVPEQRWSDTWFFAYAPPGRRHALTGAAAYRAAIARHYFSLVILDFGATPRLDNLISADLEQAGGYRITAVVHSASQTYTIWAHGAPGQPGGPDGHH